MSEYRTPEEDQAQAAHEARVRMILDQAVRDGAWCKVAMLLGEPADVVERWTDTVWGRLRAGLAEGGHAEGSLIIEDRLTAIVLLLEDRMEREANAVIRSIRGES